MGITNNLNANKSPGHDELPILLIKESKYAICSYLTKTINKCLLIGHYPDILKIAKVTPIFKRGQRNDPSNYRPISVLSPFNKIFELVIKNRLLKFWEKCNIFSPTQFGSRKGYSTNLVITQLYDHLLHKTLEKHYAQYFLTWLRPLIRLLMIFYFLN